MDFSTVEFAIFFAAVFAVYYLPPLRGGQTLLLVVASLVFYAWTAPILLLLLFLSVCISVSTSYVVLRGRHRQRVWAAGIGVVLNLGLLAFFKYKFLFIDASAVPVALSGQSLMTTLLLLPLPIGISFYTFHGVSLLIDCLRGETAFFRQYKVNFSKHFLDTVLYLTFFPQLIAGPIVKARDFYPQIAPKRFGSINWHYAFDCLVLGYFLKKVVADSLQEQTFWMSMPYFKGIGSANLLIMLYGYSIQIFADFAGYSLIALGLAALLGYRLPDNFNFPYISQSISEFWRRWHISLSSWLRDYLYIPLGGSRHGNLRTYFNLLVVMFLGGLWHGAAWSFAVWGLWHGAGLALERPFLNSRFYTSRRTPLVALRMLSVFAFVSAGWLLFKMPVFADAVAYLQAIGSNWAIPIYPVGAFLILLYSVPVVIYHLTYLSRPRGAELMLPVAQAGMIFLIVLNAGPRVPFVYFQF